MLFVYLAQIYNDKKPKSNGEVHNGFIMDIILLFILKP